MSQTIPAKDADFDEKQSIITTKTEVNMNNWRIDPSWYSGQVSPAKTKWAAAWAAWQNPYTRTPLITFAKNDARKNYEPLLSRLVGLLKNSPFVTPADLAAMGIATGKGGGGSHNPPPGTFPDFDIDTSVIRRITVHYYDHGARSHAKPHGIQGAELCWAILPAPPKSIRELVNSSFDTRSPCTFEFEEDQRGLTLWLCLRWENTTGEKGPWSEIVSAIIP
jgi:hypothetical protein